MSSTTEYNSHPDVDYNKIFDEIEIQCKKNQFTLQEIINDFDQKEEGKVSRFKFEKIFNALSFWIRKPVLDQIIIEYTVYEDVVKSSLNKETGEVTKTTQTIPFMDLNGVTYVDTNKFLQDYNLYISSKNNNNKNNLTTSFKKEKTYSQASSSLITTTPKSADDFPTDNDLIRFGNSLKFQNTSIQDVMESFDSHHVGHVPVNKFLNGFGINNLTKKIANAYKRPPTNDVYYIDLQRDVANVMNNNSINKTNRGNLNLLSSINEDNNFTYNGRQMPDFFPSFCHKLRLNGFDPYLALSVYDKHKRQSILPCHFLATFINFDPNFSAPQIQLLKDVFLNEEGKFDYMSFCEAVDYENSKYEKELEKTSSEHSQTIQKKLAFEDESTKKDVSNVINSIKDRIEIRHALLGDIIESYDPTKTGKILAKTFFKILDQERYDVDLGDKKSLLDEFGDSTGKYILYRPFIIAVTPPKRKPDASSQEYVLDRLKEHLNKTQTSIKPLLLRLDSERTGYVSFRQLLAVFSNISFDINNHERRALLSKITDQINIQNFCDLVDYKVPEEPHKEEEEEDEDNVPTKDVLDALARLYSVVLAEENRIDLLDEFSRFPSSPDGLMNISQFKSSLFNIPSLERIPPEDISLFATYYTNKSNNMINLKNFINDLVKFGDDQLKMEPSLSLYPPNFSQFKPTSPVQSQPQQSVRFQNTVRNQDSKNVASAFEYSSPLIKNKTSSRLNFDGQNSKSTNSLNNSFCVETAEFDDLSETVSGLMRRLKVYLKKKELNPHSLFVMYDTFGNGYIPKDRVSRIFSSIYFEYSPDELQEILRVFQSFRLNNCFNYRRFLDALERIQSNVDDFKSMRVKPLDEDPNNHPQDYQLVSLISTLHSKLFDRHKRAEIVFLDLTEPIISANEFRQRIKNYGLIIPLSDVQLLIESYRANFNNDIDWKRFCNDVNSYKTVEPPRI